MHKLLSRGNETNKHISKRPRVRTATILRTPHTNGTKQRKTAQAVQTTIHKHHIGLPLAVGLREPIPKEQPNNKRRKGPKRLLLRTRHGQILEYRRQQFSARQTVPRSSIP